MKILNVLLLEGIHPQAVQDFQAQGMNVELVQTALQDQELIDKLQGFDLLGIRSRTQITEEVIQACPNLLAVGCFCIGTNQVDLGAVQIAGIPVFNAPFSNTRSVAELTIASAVMLMRGVAAKNAAAHRGEWLKSAENSYEVRSKKLGIIGYGNIGSQLSVLASGMGMHVYYYDVESKLPHGNARMAPSLQELLAMSDVITLHVPSTPETKNIINAKTIAQMKDGAFLINYSRGDVVDIDALKQALETGKIRGAALDVFPSEPKSKQEAFQSPLRGIDNVLITPHVGGSTLEAQENIGNEVADKLIRYAQNGTTKWAVNFPEVRLKNRGDNTHRLLHVHENKPGVLKQINDIISDFELNVSGQSLQTKDEIGYVVIDIEGVIADEVSQLIKSIDGTIRMRLI